MSRRGRAARLPSSGAATLRGVLADGTTVRCFEDGNGEAVDFACSNLAVSKELQRMFAEAFARRTAPGRGLRAMESMRQSFRIIRLFALYLSGLQHPPARKAELTPEHIDGFLAHRGAGGPAAKLDEELRGIKIVLRQLDSWSPRMVAKLAEPNPPRVRLGKRNASYSRAEFQRIATAARQDLREAAERIRHNRAILEQYRSGQIEVPSKEIELLDYVERRGDVPRRGKLPVPWVRDGEFGTPPDIVRWAHLSPVEVSAGSILLTVLTGQNPYVIIKCTAAHHRADGYAGGPETAIVGARKPRRRSRAEMDIALTAVPDWISIPDNPATISRRDELHTAFGVYMLMLELTASSRRIEGSDRLMVAYCTTGGSRGIHTQKSGGGWVQLWSQTKSILADAVDGQMPEPLHVSLVRLRMTYLELHQKPVAHTEQTLADDYLGRNRGNLQEYRKVVADALQEQVVKAHALPLMSELSVTEIAEAQEDPTALASRLSLSPADVRRMLKGKLDTVMNACVDNKHGPFGDPGQPCRVSFMMCLGCPCARSMPRHLPVQILVFDRLAERRHEMTPLAWAKRFALPHAQLSDLLARYDGDEIVATRAATTDAHRELVGRFLNRELDLR